LPVLSARGGKPGIRRGEYTKAKQCSESKAKTLADWGGGGGGGGVNKKARGLTGRKLYSHNRAPSV